MSSKRVTLQDIANVCGVSRNTVSLALRGEKKRMAPGTYREILRVTEELGYERDPQISNLTRYLADQRRGHHVQGELAYLVTLAPDVPDFGRNLDFLHMLKEPARKHGFHVERYEYGEYVQGKEGLSRKQIERIWDTRGVQGVFVAPVYEDYAPVMSWEKYAWLAFGDSLTEPRLHVIDSDFFQSVFDCFEHLRLKGYQRIGCYAPYGMDVKLRFALRSASNAYRLSGPELECLSVLEKDLPGVYSVVRRAVTSWIHKHKLQAVIGDFSCYRYLKKMGFNIPEDLGFANWLLGPDEPDELSGILRAHEDLGTSSIELMLSQIHHGNQGIPNAPIRSRIRGHWVDGSTAPGP